MAAGTTARFMWRRIDSAGLEVCELKSGAHAHSLHGNVLVRSGRFQRDLVVAPNGMVISYPGLWEAC